MANEYQDPNEWAARLKEIFDALTLHGFTEEQAIELMKAAFTGD